MAKPSLSDFVKIEDNIVSSTVPIDLEGKTLAKELFAVLEAETDKVVIVDSVTGKTWTGNEALRDVKRLASALISEGMKKGQIVAVLTDDKYPGLNAILFMVVVAAGAVYEGGDFRYPEREMHVLLENSDVEYIIASETTVDTVLKAAAGIDRIKKIYLIDPPSSESTPLFPRLFDLPPGGTVQLPVPVDQHDPAVQGFSSGTTGTPKTIVKSQRSAVFYKGMGHAPFFFGGRPGDTVLVPVPLYHLSDVALLVNVLLNGSTVILHSHTVKTTPVAGATGATSAFIVTSEATFLAKDPIEVDLKLTDIIIAGSVLSKEIGLSFMQRYKVPKLRNTYGASETGWTTMLPYFYDSDDFACLGIPLPGCTFKVTNSVTNEILGPDEIGEICIKVSGFTVSYHRNSAANASCNDKDGFYKSGDAGYFTPEGLFYITDRYKEIIKCDGVQVSPTELESILLSHQSVREASVIGVPHPEKAEVAKAWVLKRQGYEQVTAQQLIDFVNNQVGPFKKLFGGLQFVDTFPRTTIGKVDRKQLHAWHRTSVNAL